VVLISVGAAPGAVAWALERIAAGEQRARRPPHTARRILVVQAMVDENKARAIDHMRPCVAGNYRHGHSRELLRLAGLPEPPALTADFRGPKIPHNFTNISTKLGGFERQPDA